MHFLVIPLLSIRFFLTNSDTLSNVVVSATRTNSNFQTLPVAISRQTISQSSLNTPEAFSSISGIFMQRTNQGGGSAFVRGLTGNQTLLILDGIRFNNSTFRYGPNQYLNTIDPFNLEKVEVLKGSGSVQYGSDALTGAIQLFTTTPQYKESSEFTGNHIARWASQGMEKSLLNRISFQSKKITAFFSAGYKSFGDISRGGSNTLQQPTGYEESNLLSKFRFKLSQKWEMEALIQQNQQYHVPVFHKIQLENYAVNEMALQNYQRAYVKWIANFNSQIVKSFDFISSYQRNIEDRTLQKNASLTTRYESDHVQTLGWISQIKSTLGQQHSATTGVELYHDLIGSTRKDINSIKTIPLRALYPDGSDYYSFSAFSLHQWQSKRWQFNAGVRYQQNTAVIPDTSVGKSTISMGAFVYDLASSYALNKRNILFFNYSTGFRAPNMDDLGSLGIVDFRYEYPAYQLKPEYSSNKTLGFRTKNGKWKSEWVIFHSDLSNLINRVKTTEIVQNYPVYRKENIDKAYIWGFEIDQQYQLNEQFDLKGNLSYTFGQNITQNEPLRRTPPLHGYFSIDYHPNQWNIGLQWIFADRQDRLSSGDKADNRMNPNGTPGWGIINSQVKYLLNSHILMSLQGINLTNVLYRMHGSGIDGMGRSVFLQLNYQW